VCLQPLDAKELERKLKNDQKVLTVQLDYPVLTRCNWKFGLVVRTVYTQFKSMLSDVSSGRRERRRRRRSKQNRRKRLGSRWLQRLNAQLHVMDFVLYLRRVDVGYL
jgi:hypothetical protein